MPPSRAFALFSYVIIYCTGSALWVLPATALSLACSMCLCWARLLRTPPGFWVLGPGSWVLAPGSWVLAPGSWVLGPRSWVLGPGS